MSANLFWRRLPQEIENIIPYTYFQIIEFLHVSTCANRTNQRLNSMRQRQNTQKNKENFAKNSI